MSDNQNDKINSFVNELLILLKSHIDDSHESYIDTNKEYHMGRLFESEAIRNSVKKLIIEKLWN